jgi:hypothetical protein
MKAAIATYLASIPDGAAKSDGVKLGEMVAARVLEAHDGYRLMVRRNAAGARILTRSG